MAGVSGIAATATALSNAELQANYQVAALKKQIEAIDQAGAAALQLIESAVNIDPNVGQSLDVLA